MRNPLVMSPRVSNAALRSTLSLLRVQSWFWHTYTASFLELTKNLGLMLRNRRNMPFTVHDGCNCIMAHLSVRFHSWASADHRIFAPEQPYKAFTASASLSVMRLVPGTGDPASVYGFVLGIMHWAFSGSVIWGRGREREGGKGERVLYEEK